MKITFSFLCFFFLLHASKAQFIDNEAFPFIGKLNQSSFTLRYYPGVNLGSHVNEVSYNVTPSLILNASEKFRTQLQFHSSFRFNLTNFGLPGPSLGMVNKASVIISLGQSSRSFQRGDLRPESFAHSAYLRHNLEYYFMHYASNDKTSQFSGGLNYTLIHGKTLVKFSFENDFMAFLGLDEFRTGGGSLDFRRIVKGRLYGIGAGALLWTGSTKGLANLDFGQQYDMSRQYGADYSHGIVFVNFHYEGLSLSLGYDSEPLRMAIQDNLHRLIDDGTIPGGRMVSNRIYFQVNILDFESLY